MRIALLSDLHANLRAVQACLAHARAQGAGRFALLGDLVGYGAEPAEVVDLAMTLQASGAVVLQGNHDQMAAIGPPVIDPGIGKPRVPTQAEAGAEWTHAQLSTRQRAFLQGLPLTHQEADCLFVHATADAPDAWRYASTAPMAARSLEAARQQGARCVFGGHVHEQRLWFAGRRGDLMPFEPAPGVPLPLATHRSWLATLGSVGQPRDGDTRAGYAMLDTGEEGTAGGAATAPRLTFFRVAYDHAAAAAAVRASGMPAPVAAAMADRLMEGR